MVKKKTTQHGHSKAKQTILAIAIALLSVFFIAYLQQTIYPAPEFNDYCPDIRVAQIYETQQQCEAVGGQWNPYAKPVPEGSAGNCDVYYTCNQDFRAASEPYERNVFIFNLLIGLAILLGAFFLGIEAISTGFMGGGTLMMVYGTMRYWGNLTNWLRTLFLGIALAALVYFGYKKLND